MKKGYFITFEGGEGAGKSTLLDKLEKYFQEKKLSFIRTREPGGTPLGEQIRLLLLENKEYKNFSSYAELALFLASRAQHVHEVIKPAMEKGKIVLCDRYNDSSIAYQGYARGIGMDKVRHFCNFMSQNMEPSLTFYLDLDPGLGLSRRKNHEKKKEYDRIESESISFHQKIREGFLKIAKEDPGRFHVIDATASIEEVYAITVSIIEKTLDI